MENRLEFENGDTYYILIDFVQASDIIELWYNKGFKCDIIIHNSKKNSRHVVLETKKVMFADMIRRYHPGCRVNIKKKENGNS